MHKLRLIVLTVLFGMLPGARLRAQQASSQEPTLVIENLSSEGEFQSSRKTGTSVWKNGVKATYGSTTLLANEMKLDDASGTVEAIGNVSLQRENQVWMGDRIIYNFRTKKMTTEHFKGGMSPYFISGEGATGGNATNHLSISEPVYSAGKTVITTDDIEDPDYKLKAKSIKVVPGKYIDARDVTFYLGDTPVMWLPYYHRSLERHPNYYTAVPGFRSTLGPYYLQSYHGVVSDNFEAAINFDLMQKRGIGVGPDFTYNLGKYGAGELRAYGLHDSKPGTDSRGQAIDPDRQRISFTHQATLRTNTTAKIVVREQSDAYFIRDFFESEYRNNTQPASYLEVNHLWPNFSLDVLAQPQINNFLETVERLPDVKLTAARQQLGISPFYYEGENSAGYFRYRSGAANGTNYAALRADSFHQIVLPNTFFGFLNFTPRVGGRITHYGETDGLSNNLDEANRFVFNTGAETSFKASRVWQGAKNKAFDVDGLRHIVEPSVNYVFVPEPNKLPTQLPQFDTEIPSLRLLPIDFPDYNSIDSVDAQNVVRLGLRNKLQTKREAVVENLVNWALITDLRLDPNQSQDTFADVFSDLDFKPRSWLTFNSELRYDVTNERWRGAHHSTTIAPNETWSLQVGHRYFRTEPLYGLGNNTVYESIYYRFNENWGARMSHHFEARDGTLEEQYYTVYRDLRTWTTAVTFRIRESRSGPTDYAVAVIFSLKAYPRFPLGGDRNNPSLLLGT